MWTNAFRKSLFSSRSSFLCPLTWRIETYNGLLSLMKRNARFSRVQYSLLSYTRNNLNLNFKKQSDCLIIPYSVGFVTFHPFKQSQCYKMSHILPANKRRKSARLRAFIKYKRRRIRAKKEKKNKATKYYPRPTKIETGRKYERFLGF